MNTNLADITSRGEKDQVNIDPILPYKGLHPYSEKDAKKFFGRGRDIQRFVNSLLAWRLTVLYGESGVGKSSLLRAGVINALQEQTEQNIKYCGRPKLAVVIFPSLDAQYSSWQGNPLESLRRLMEAEMDKLGLTVEPLEPKLSLVEMLEVWTDELSGENLDGRLLIILDQFEEYFQYHPQKESDGGFIAEVAKVLNQSHLRVNFLISLREDFFVKLNELRGIIPNILDICLSLEHLNKDSAEDAIKKPIDEYYNKLEQVPPEEQIKIEPKLIEALLQAIPRTEEKSAGRAGLEKSRPVLEDQIVAPYLQLVMERLWGEMVKANSHILSLQTLTSLGDKVTKNGDEDKISSSILNLETLTRLGNKDTNNDQDKIKAAIQNILYQHISDVLDSKEISNKQREIAADIFQYLVTPSRTKYAYCIDDLADLTKCNKQEINDLLKILSKDQRIIRRIAPLTEQSDMDYYEIFHDFLASPILKWRRQYLDETKRDRDLIRKLLNLALILAVVGPVLWLGKNLNQKQLKAWTEKTDNVMEIFEHKEQISALMETVKIGNNLQKKDWLFIHPAIKNIIFFTLDERENLIKKVGWNLQTILDNIQEKNEITSPTPEPIQFFFSPDGKTLALVTANNQVQLWDWPAAQDLGKTFPASGQVLSLGFSPDGKTLAVATADNQVQLRDWQARSSLGRTFTASGQVLSLGFSPDGRTLAVLTADKQVQLWDWQAQPNPISLPLGQGFLFSFSPDGKTLAVATADNQVQLWDWQTRSSLGKTFTASAQVLSLGFSPPDGKTLAVATADNQVQLWNWQTPQDPVRISASGLVSGLGFSPDGQILAVGSTEGTVQLWDWRNQKNLFEIKASGLILNIRFSPDGETLALDIVSKEGKRRVGVWNWQARQDLVKISVSAQVSGLSPAGQTLAVGSTDGTVRFWDWQIPQDLNKEITSAGQLSGLSFSPDGQILAVGSTDGTVQFWDWQNRQNLNTQLKASGEVTSLSFSPDGQILAVGSTDGTVQLWNWQDQQSLVEILGSSLISGLSFSPDGQTLAVGSTEGKVKLWDRQTQQYSNKEFTASGLVSGLSFSPDGQILAVGSTDGTVQLWDWQAQQSLVKIPASGLVSGLSFSPDGKTLNIVLIRDGQVLLKRLNAPTSLTEVLEKGCQWLKPYLDSHSAQKQESGCQ